MAVYEIVKDEHPVLREIAKPIPKINPNIHKLLKNMSDTMYDAKGVGLAAPQIGISKRAVVIDVGEGLIQLINPEIIHLEGQEIDEEGCLSYPGVTGEVSRATKCRVRAMDPSGNEIELEGEGLLARAFQHEIDHLNGIVFLDKAKNIRKTK